jgi:hypothetical protein
MTFTRILLLLIIVYKELMKPQRYSDFSVIHLLLQASAKMSANRGGFLQYVRLAMTCIGDCLPTFPALTVGTVFAQAMARRGGTLRHPSDNNIFIS